MHVDEILERAASLAGHSALASRQGDEAGCRADAAESLGICETRHLHLHLAEAWALSALGDLELSLGDARAAVVRLRALETLLTGHGMADPDLSPCPELVEALMRDGDPDAARRLVPPFLAAADAKGQPSARARARRAAGLVAPDEEIDTVFEEALDLHRQTQDSFETARTRLAHGDRLRRTCRRVDARGHLRPALASFDRLGAACWAQRPAAELTATGETVQRLDVGWRAELTPQELQVGLLLAEGHTTSEAAAALFVSPKTVEYHLRKVYTKLEIHPREELATALVADAATADPGH